MLNTPIVPHPFATMLQEHQDAYSRLLCLTQAHHMETVSRCSDHALAGCSCRHGTGSPQHGGLASMEVCNAADSLWQASKGISVAREHGQTMLGILCKGIICRGKTCKGITRKAHQCTRELAMAWGRALSSSRLNSLLLPTCLPATTIVVDKCASIS